MLQQFDITTISDSDDDNVLYDYLWHMIYIKYDTWQRNNSKLKWHRHDRTAIDKNNDKQCWQKNDKSMTLNSKRIGRITHRL